MKKLKYIIITIFVVGIVSDAVALWDKWWGRNLVSNSFIESKKYKTVSIYIYGFINFLVPQKDQVKEKKVFYKCLKLTSDTITSKGYSLVETLPVAIVRLHYAVPKFFRDLEKTNSKFKTHKMHKNHFIPEMEFVNDTDKRMVLRSLLYHLTTIVPELPDPESTYFVMSKTQYRGQWQDSDFPLKVTPHFYYFLYESGIENFLMSISSANATREHLYDLRYLSAAQETDLLCFIRLRGLQAVKSLLDDPHYYVDLQFIFVDPEDGEIVFFVESRGRINPIQIDKKMVEATLLNFPMAGQNVKKYHKIIDLKK